MVFNIQYPKLELKGFRTRLSYGNILIIACPETSLCLLLKFHSPIFVIYHTCGLDTQFKKLCLSSWTADWLVHFQVPFLRRSPLPASGGGFTLGSSGFSCFSHCCFCFFMKADLRMCNFYFCYLSNFTEAYFIYNKLNILNS